MKWGEIKSMMRGDNTEVIRLEAMRKNYDDDAKVYVDMKIICNTYRLSFQDRPCIQYRSVL